MKKALLSLAIPCLAFAAMADTPQLGGFFYGNDSAPGGHEWQSVDSLAYNKEFPHATIYPFESIDNARKVLPENSHYWMSLNGTWKFNWVPVPDKRPKDFYLADYDVTGWDDIQVPSSWNIAGIQKDGTQKYGTPIYVNQPVIFMHERKVGDWRGGVMRTPPTTWTTYNARNEVGSYRRTFTIPQNWEGRETYISFDGVDSFFYLWINGKYVGFSKNSRNAARFNITKYLKKGENTVAVEVYRSSDGSFLEAQDMFRLPGIFRTVALISTPQVEIRDLTVIPDLTDNYTNGKLNVTTSVRNLSKKNVKDYKIEYTLYANELYSDNNTPVNGVDVTTAAFNVAKNAEVSTSSVINVTDPNKWSAEAPYRYTLVAQLKDKKGKVVETVSTYVGFRKVEVKDTPASEDEFGLAGRYFYVNGMPVKLKGVNRHETQPDRGHAITRKHMEDEVMMMKRANINHVRNSHYPDDPYWYYLCDKYGIYLEDEANIESHEYYYGKESLSHPVEWKNAHVARNMEMVHSTVNSPSIVIWSLGNEAGPGENFVAAYNAIKEFDTSRPVQYERNNSIVDIGSNQYPPVPWVEEVVKGKSKIKYPFHISEYAHSMGNAVGNLVDYWKAIESTNFLMGGAIWDWIDQSLYNYDSKTGDRYLAYGGDFGDFPNDGQFVMNGIIFGDMTPKPQYFEVKKVYQNVGVEPVDIKAGKIDIFNKNYFIPLTDYTIGWSLYEDGVKVDGGDALIGPRMALGPRQKMTYTIPYDYSKLKPESEYFATVEFKLANDKPWAKAGYVQMDEQLPVKAATSRTPILDIAKGKKPTTVNEDGFITINGDGFKAKFDLNKGTIYSLQYGDKNIISDGNGPELYAFRAFVNNDNWIYTTWFENGLHNLQHKALSTQVNAENDGRVVLSFIVQSQAPNSARILGGTSSGHNKIVENTENTFGPDNFKFITNQIWTVYPDGSIELQSAITSNNPQLILPRLGYQMKVNKDLDNFTYYGRGPIENYADRKTGQFVSQYSSKVADQFVDYAKPQNMANHEDVRWAALTDNRDGAIFIAPDNMSTTALQYSELDLMYAPHPYQLPNAGDTYLHLDLGMTGLGGTSCGQDAPFESDRIRAASQMFSFIIRPVKASNLNAAANVAPSGLKPIIVDSRKGTLTISSPYGDEEVLYTIDGAKKPSTYAAPIKLKQGGTLKAWVKDRPLTSIELTLPKYDAIDDIEVINTSSQEPGEEASRLIDGDPNTIWHTAYSVTVANYPHFVDFKTEEEKSIKGLTYLPRQDSYNGNIKDYEIYVSNDPNNWGTPVAKGSFERNTKLKTVKFDKPVKGRYIRFKGMNSQDGQDFASGAEITILAE